MFLKLARWLTYPAGNRRDLRLDLIRGYCVFMMIVDHVSGPSWLYWVTGNNRYLVSAAEGFVLISGIVMGIVYRPTAERLGFEEMFIRALDRARQLYLVFVGLTLARTGLALALGSPTSRPIEDPLSFVIGVLTLHQSAYLTDVMLFYTLVVALAPLPILLFRQQATGLALAGSWLLWLLYQVFPEQAEIPWPIANQEAFPFAAWQLLFFNGLAIGFHRNSIARWIRRYSPVRVFVVLFVGMTLTLLLDRYDAKLASYLTEPAGTFVSELFYKFDVRPGRVIAIVFVFGSAYFLLTYFWRPIAAVLGWLMLPLGQHALDAYGLHIFFVVLVGALRTRVAPLESLPIGWNTALQVICLLAIWAAVRFGLIDLILGRDRRPERTGRPAVQPT